MKKTNFGAFILLIVAIQIFSSCQSINRLMYFQKGPGQSDTLTVPKAEVSKIQSGDILGITVESLNSQASSFFNPLPIKASPTNTTSTIASLNASEAAGFLVDELGNIELPLVGSIKMQGLTTLQAKELLLSKLKSYLKEPTVTVRVLNYRITLMGEVTRPSVYVIPNERITVIEAINLAGDLTQYGKRNNIMIVRDVDGKKVIGRINLNDRSVFNSQYYYLHANDLVYVEPIAGKSLASSTFIRVLPIIAGILSLVTLVYIRFIQ